MSTPPSIHVLSQPHLPMAVFVLSFIAFFSGCRKEKLPSPAAQAGAHQLDSMDGDADGAVESEAVAIEVLEENFARVHFDFDSAREKVQAAYSQ